MGTSASGKSHNSRTGFDASMRKAPNSVMRQSKMMSCFSAGAAKSVQSSASTPGGRVLRVIWREVELRSEQLGHPRPSPPGSSLIKFERVPVLLATTYRNNMKQPGIQGRIKLGGWEE